MNGLRLIFKPEYSQTPFRDFVHIGQLNPSNGRWNVFPYGAPVLTTDTYPDDVDTTVLALLKLDVPDAVKHKTMDDILENRNSDGLVYVG